MFLEKPAPPGTEWSSRKLTVKSSEAIPRVMGRGLSPQQRLILRVLAQEGPEKMAIERLSWAVAEAFDVEGSRIFTRWGRRLTGAHRASFSRSLRRLEDRGLLVRLNRDFRSWGWTYWVRLTENEE